MEDKTVNETASDLEKIVDGVFDGDDLTVTYDEPTEELSIFPMYAAKIDFHVGDVNERQADGTLEIWAKAEIAKALRSLGELIKVKVNELDG